MRHGLILHLGDDAKVAIWNLRAPSPGPEWVTHVPQHGAICSGTWAPVKGNHPVQRIIFGCVDGSIHIYRCTSPGDFSFVCKVRPYSDAVQDLVFDANYGRLASVGGSQLTVWNIGLQGILFPLLFPLKLTPLRDEPLQIAITSPRDSIARSAGFIRGGTAVLVAFLQSHEV